MKTNIKRIVIALLSITCCVCLTLAFPLGKKQYKANVVKALDTRDICSYLYEKNYYSNVDVSENVSAVNGQQIALGPTVQ